MVNVITMVTNIYGIELLHLNILKKQSKRK